jgi:hypothetical protein
MLRISGQSASCRCSSDKCNQLSPSRGGDQVFGSLSSHTGISLRSLSHLCGVETPWEIGQLMDYDVRASRQDRSGKFLRVEHIDHYRLDTNCA